MFKCIDIFIFLEFNIILDIIFVIVFEYMY